MMIPLAQAVTVGETSIIKLDPKGDDDYNLIFENSQGLVYNVPYITNEKGVFKYGNDNRDFVFQEATKEGPAGLLTQTIEVTPTIGHLDYFVLTDLTTQLGKNIGFDTEGISRVWRYDNYDANDNTLKFKDMATGDTHEVTVTPLDYDHVIGHATLVTGGIERRVYLARDNNANPDLAIDQNGDNKMNGARINILGKGGSVVFLSDYYDAQYSVNGQTIPGTTSTFHLTTMIKQLSEQGVKSPGGGDHGIYFTIEQRGTDEIGFDKDKTISNTPWFLALFDDIFTRQVGNYHYGEMPYGTGLSFYDEPGNDPETLTIEYPVTFLDTTPLTPQPMPDVLHDVDIIAENHDYGDDYIICGDNICNADFENARICPADCSRPIDRLDKQPVRKRPNNNINHCTQELSECMHGDTNYQRCKLQYERCATPVEIIEPTCDNGCYVNEEDSCLPTTTRLIVKDEAVYCGLDKELHTQKADNEAAQNDYECQSNSARYGICEPVAEQVGFVKQLFTWFATIFGG